MRLKPPPMTGSRKAQAGRWRLSRCIATTKFAPSGLHRRRFPHAPPARYTSRATILIFRSYITGMTQPVFHSPDHDHQRCTADALAHAEAMCAQRSQRLTPIRRQVLEVLLESHKPLGAYEIMDRAAASGGRLAPSGGRPAPITIY